MTPGLFITAVRRPWSEPLQHFFWTHPEWWSIALSAAAWIVMLRHGWQHAGHELHHRLPYAQEVEHWLLMVAAMMLPLVLGRIWLTAANSLWSRRHRAIAGFLAGYFALWLLVGFAAAALRLSPLSHTYAAPAVAYLAAALWQLTPLYRRALAACHRTYPLAPTGWTADRDCLRSGASIGLACVRSCWPLMLACALSGHGIVAMTGGMAVGVIERWTYRPATWKRIAPTLALATYYLLQIA